MAKEGIGRHISDAFYQVPPRTDPTYLGRILNICEEEHVDVYYALGEEEALAASRNRAAFDAIGVGVITPGPPEMVAIATNKCLWHDFFAREGVPHADYRTIESVDTIAAAARALGYPDNDVVIKPSASKGGRGARIITARDLSYEYYQDRSEPAKTSLDSFMNMLSPLPKDKFMPLLAMEYLPGTLYSVDVLSRSGQTMHVVPKIRIAGSASNTTVGQVDLNPDTIRLAQLACAAFRFSFLQNYEMKLDRNGQPRIYDINPRGGASLALCAAAGANIAYYAVKMAIGEEVPCKSVRNGVRMTRFYSEYYE